jgi:AcrR family transcriptional regulator
MARYRVGLETRDRILHATREVLGEQGLDRTTLKAITHRAGVGAGSFYNLFDSKEEAVLEVLREAIMAVDPHPDGIGQEALDELVDAFVSFVVGPTATLARIYDQLAASALTEQRIASRLQRSHQRRVERFTAALRRSRPGLDVTAARTHAEVLLAALMGLALRYVLDPDFDIEGHAAELVHLPVHV